MTASTTLKSEPAWASAQSELRPLRFLRSPETLRDKAIGNDLRQTQAMTPADQLKHQVERRQPAGAGQAIAIDLE